MKVGHAVESICQSSSFNSVRINTCDSFVVDIKQGSRVWKNNTPDDDDNLVLKKNESDKAKQATNHQGHCHDQAADEKV